MSGLTKLELTRNQDQGKRSLNKRCFISIYTCASVSILVMMVINCMPLVAFGILCMEPLSS